MCTGTNAARIGVRQQQRREDEKQRELREIDHLDAELGEEDQQPGQEQAHERSDQRGNIEVGVAARGDDDDDLARGLALGLRDRVGDAPLLVAGE